jgi:hypothetical protein
MAFVSLFSESFDALKGRCAIATKDLKEGVCILKTFAFSAVSTSACNWCFVLEKQAFSSLKKCGQCQMVRYCSRKCQQEDWKQNFHSEECFAFANINNVTKRKKKPSQTILLVTRLAYQIYIKKQNRQEFEKLQGHYGAV